MNDKSYVIRYMSTLQIFGTPKSCIFSKILKRYLINSTLQVELSCRLVICRGHVQRSYLLPDIINVQK